MLSGRWYVVEWLGNAARNAWLAVGAEKIQLTMKLPFTVDQFLDIFRNYNTAVYPTQFLLVLLACVAIFLAFKKTANSNQVILLIVAAFWFWMGAIYHIGFFSTINKAAYIFGSLFIVEGFLLVYYAFRRPYSFVFQSNIYGFASVLLLLYALVIYPLIGHFSGHAYPYAPTFGLPCPTTIFTFGILLLSVHRLPLLIVIVPLLWSIIGFSAAFSLGIHEDTGLIVSGILFAILNYKKHIYRLYTIE